MKASNDLNSTILDLKYHYFLLNFQVVVLLCLTDQYYNNFHK